MKKSWLPLAVLALMAAGCSSGEDNLPVDLTDTPITVNASVNPISASLAMRSGGTGNAGDTGGDNSGSSSTTTSDLPEKFYLKITNAVKTPNYCYDAVMKHPTGQTTWQSYTKADETVELLMLWADSKTDVDVKASTFEISDTAVPLSAAEDQSDATKLKESDHLMWDNPTQSPSTGVINVLFGHVMAKLNIIITLGNEYDGTANPITSVTVGGTKVSGEFTRGTTTWDLTKVTAAKSVNTHYTADSFVAYNADTKAKATAQYEAILVPQTVAADGFYVEIVMNNNKTYKWTSKADVTMAQGTAYNLELTAGKDKVESLGFSPVAWGAGNTGTDLATD